MTVFSVKTIEEITEILIDYRGQTPPKSSSGVKLITAKVIKDGFIQDGNHEYISEETYDSWMRRGLPRQWDILITTEAPLGQVAQLRTSEEVALAQRVILLRGDPAVIDQQYYFQALKSPFVQAGLEARATGTTVLGIKQSELRHVEIPYYPLPIQRKIAAILSAYDDLIENNTRRIRLLEEMARLLYREWFVRFRFPGHASVRLVDSPLGPIPEGWEVVRLGEIADINATTIKRGEEPEEIDYIDITSVSIGQINEIKHFAFADAPGRARRIVQHGDVIWSTVRPNRRSYTLILDPSPNLIVSTGFAVISARQVPYTYLYYALTTDEFVGYLANHATGSAYPAALASDFADADILLPPQPLSKMFHDVVVNVFDQRENLARRNSSLRRTRDLLLPRLISGALDVADLKIEVGD